MNKQTGLIMGMLWQKEFPIQAFHNALPKIDKAPKNINKHILTSPLLAEANCFYREETEMGDSNILPTEIYGTWYLPAPRTWQQWSSMLESEAFHHG